MLIIGDQCPSNHSPICPWISSHLSCFLAFSSFSTDVSFQGRLIVVGGPTIPLISPVPLDNIIFINMIAPEKCNIWGYLQHMVVGTGFSQERIKSRIRQYSCTDHLSYIWSFPPFPPQTLVVYFSNPFWKAIESRVNRKLECLWLWACCRICPCIGPYMEFVTNSTSLCKHFLT